MTDLERIIENEQRRLDELSKPEIWARYTKNMEGGELRAFIQSYRDSQTIVAALRRTAEHDKAMEEGRLVRLPFVAMVEQSLQGDKMKPERDQRFNGRYAVVYSGKGKWGCPLIDICGTSYNSDQAEERKNELTRQEAEAALEVQK